MEMGDARSLAHFYDDLEAKTLAALAREDGLISTTSGLVADDLLKAIHLEGELRDIVDWPQGERDGFEMRPVNTVVNAFHYRALVLMGRIAAALDRPDDAQRWRRCAERVAASVCDKLFDHDRGVFTDGEGSDHCSLHANMFPLAFGLVPEGGAKSVAEFVKGRGMACSVYGAQFLLEALYRAGEADAALALLTSTSERSWAHMIYDVGSTMALEAWDNRFKPNQDWNHAWGAAPANIIPHLLMGVRALTPGFGRMLIQPQPGALGFAEMVLPTIRGPVAVRFENRLGRSFFLEVEIPGNTEARVALPRLDVDDPAVLMDGAPAVGRVTERSVLIDSVGSGRHTFLRTG